MRSSWPPPELAWCVLPARVPKILASVAAFDAVE
ncbi:hypothetical protein BJY18_007108 [Amycolatopsis jiangsuensis]|uniref:Uncharacterized protein n=1 Tax=Amycolatopsis jiangsuensis TaxID=1181879 RepID=A0A840J758_9PSEU|nr:hypothetical protein [Amycolatopsis jiangsuensis]